MIKSNQNSLTEIGLKYSTDKAYWHRYTDVYDKWFTKYRYDHINILEIGILNGNSLKMLEEYFPNAKIYAIDILDLKHLSTLRTTCLMGDQENPDTILKHFTNIDFDIIIDDGSHISKHQIQCFVKLWPKLKNNGLYIIEDLHPSYKINNNTSAYYTCSTFSTTKKLNSSYISSSESELIECQCLYSEVWKRDFLPSKCWKCKNENLSGSHCICGVDLINDGNGSITSAFWK